MSQVDAVWQKICEEAREEAEREPVLETRAGARNVCRDLKRGRCPRRVPAPETRAGT